MEEGQQGARHGGRATVGLDVGPAARPTALDEHDVVARSAQPVDHGERRVAGAHGPADDRDPRTGRHRGRGHRRTEGGRAPRDTADGEVGGAAHLHDGERGGEASQARAASLTRKARATVSSGSVADVTSVWMPGRGIRCAVADARERTRAAASATRCSGSRPACTADTMAVCTAS